MTIYRSRAASRRPNLRPLRIAAAVAGITWIVIVTTFIATR